MAEVSGWLASIGYVPTYRTFESLNQLIYNVETARSLLGNSCVINRVEVLALIDVIRDALPQELDDAQDVLDEQDDIIAKANAYREELQLQADEVLRHAEEDAHNLIAKAHADADALLHRAQEEAARIGQEADESAREIVDSAHAKAEDTVNRASAEAQRRIDEGEAHFQRSVDEGLLQQSKLVSESEVVRRANDEAHRIVEEAHAASNDLRARCDSYVDQKLGEFETSLNETLRTVRSDRSALRGGAGVAGRESYGTRD